MGPYKKQHIFNFADMANICLISTRKILGSLVPIRSLTGSTMTHITGIVSFLHKVYSNKPGVTDDPHSANLLDYSL